MNSPNTSPVTKPTQEALVKEYSPLVKSIAQRVRRELTLTTELDDLIASGVQGLLEAHSRFDPTRGVQFSTFAYYRIRGAVLDGVRKMGYMPRRAWALVKASEAGDDILENENPGSSPADAAAAAESLADVLSKLTASYVMAIVGQEENGAAPSETSPEEMLGLAQMQKRVRDALVGLPEREAEIIRGYYFEGKSLDEVATSLGISKSWASRMHSKALVLLRDKLNDL